MTNSWVHTWEVVLLSVLQCIWVLNLILIFFKFSFLNYFCFSFFSFYFFFCKVLAHCQSFHIILVTTAWVTLTVTVSLHAQSQLFPTLKSWYGHFLIDHLLIPRPQLCLKPTFKKDTTTQYSSFHRHIQNEMIIIGLISVINLLPHDSDDTSRLCCAKATLSPPGWRRTAWHRSVNLIKLFVEWFSCCLVSDDLTSDSNGIRNAVQLRVFIYKPPSHGVQEQRFSLAFSQLTF